MHWIALDAETFVNLACYTLVRFYTDGGGFAVDLWTNENTETPDNTFYGAQAKALLRAIDAAATANWIPTQEESR